MLTDLQSIEVNRSILKCKTEHWFINMKFNDHKLLGENSNPYSQTSDDDNDDADDNSNNSTALV
jgi:hypothetical protein